MSAEMLAFLRTMADQPGDSVTPLIFADWLEEHNDPRSGYIRLAHEWLLADQAAADDPSPNALDQCYLAMNQAKAAFLPLLNTVLRGACLQRSFNFTAAHGFVESVTATVEKLARISNPALTHCMNHLTLSFWPISRVPAALDDFSFPLLHTVEIAPSDWIRVPYDTAAVFLDVIRWLDRPALAHVRNLQIQIPSGRGLGGMLEWLRDFEPSPNWSSKTVRVLPPFYYREPRATDGLPVEVYRAFAASPFAQLLAREDIEALDPTLLALQPPQSGSLPPIELRDFFRCTNLRTVSDLEISRGTLAGHRTGRRTGDEKAAAGKRFTDRV